ncbi:MAG: thiamine phosphate synthase [Polyangiaceae bacterium]
MRGLYAIVDVIRLEQQGLDPIRFAKAVLRGAPVALQIRDKRLRAAETLATLRALRGPCTESGVLLFANDRADLAALAHCDGVHVGQNDLPHVEARRAATWHDSPAKVGVSLHNLPQLDSVLDASVDAWPDYLAFGPVFATRSKMRPDPVLGIETLRELTRRAATSGRPTVAIGGIDLFNIAEVAPLCSCVAVIGALLPDLDATGPDRYADVAKRTAELGGRLKEYA